MKKLSKVLIITLFSIILSSCATRISYTTTRPAQLDLNGAKTISVLSFKPYAYFNKRNDARGVEVFINSFFEIFDRVGPEEKQALEYLHDYIEDGLVNSPYIDVIASSAVQNAIKQGYLIPADVYLTGEVTYFSVSDKKETERIVIKHDDEDDDDPRGRRKEEYRYVDYFTRYVNFDFRYEVVDSSTNKIISYDKVSISRNSSRYERPRDLPDGFSLIKSDIGYSARKILKELQPYTVTLSVELLKDKTKNPEMKNADKLAKDNYIEESYKQFRRIYNETGLFEAGYNAAILQEALGNLSTAEKEMSELYNKTNDSRAYTALQDIRYEIKQAKRLIEQTESSDDDDYLE